MKSRVDDLLRREVRFYDLRYTCEQCAAFDDSAASCAYGYPTELHRDADLESRDEIVFCKAFDLL